MRPLGRQLADGHRREAWNKGRLATHCKRGHPLEGHNVIHERDGRRTCRPCKYALEREYRARRKAQGYPPRRQGRRKTHCKRGHLLEGGNVYITREGSRQCRACLKTYMRAYRAAKRREKAKQQPPRCANY